MSKYRFNRDYELIVQVSPSKLITIKPPFKITFDVSKSVAGGLNNATIIIDGLGKSNRLALAKDKDDNTKFMMGVVLRAGYEGNLRQIFQGNLQRGETSRDGAAYATEIDCIDGGYDYANSFTARTIRPGADPIDAILSDMPNTVRGKIAEIPVAARPRVLIGASHNLIGSVIGSSQSWYIDDGQLCVIGDSDVISDYTPVVSSKTGLLGTPSREQLRISLDTMFNPALRIGGLCSVESLNAPHLNGVYKIDSMGYTGDNYGSKWMQTVGGILKPEYTVIN